MNSTMKTLGLITLALLLTACSSFSPKRSTAPTQTVDFEGLQQKAQLISARTADLKKYKVREVSF